MNRIQVGSSNTGRFDGVQCSIRHIAFGLFCLSTSSCVLISGSVNPFSRQPQPLREHVVSSSGAAKILLLDVSERKRIISDGRVLSARQAFDAGLVDRIGYLDDTIEVTKSRAGLSEARIILYRRSDELAENLYSRAGFATPQINLINLDLSPALTKPQFLYL